jgi:transposase
VAHRACLKEEEPQPRDAGGTPPGTEPAGAQPAAPPAEPYGLHDVCGRERRLVRRTRERHAAVHELLAAGRSLSAISRTLGLDRQTVQRFARQPDVATLLVKATSRDSKLDPFKPWINQRWNEGITDAAALHAELRAQGWKGVQAVCRHVRQFRPLAAAPPPAVPKARQITRWLLSRPASLDPGEQAQLDAIRARCPHLDALAAAHLTSFAEMMTGRSGDRQLDDWLAAVEADHQPHLHSFAADIRRDHAAVTAGLTLPYSSGVVEGNVNRKMLKRQMYGRARFGLLRKRVILHPG